jgi:uncharacterized protein YndB with AHSA1/START domain
MILIFSTARQPTTDNRKNMTSEFKWKLNLRSSPSEVFKIISTDKGRAQFWAESTVEKDGFIHFKFPNGQTYKAQIIESQEEAIYKIEYFHSLVTFYLIQNESGGTDLTLKNERILPEEYQESLMGWISVLLALKAAADFQIDLRNHNPVKTWDQFYVDN